MDLINNSVSSNRIALNIRLPQGGEVSLNKGEVLSAQVQDVGNEGRIIIMVKGQLIEAATEVLVKPGQQLLLLVDDVRNSKTYLRVVTPEMTGKIENANISAHLLEMGIAAKEDVILLARKLLKYNLPVNPSNLSELNKNITQLGVLNGRNAEIAAFALSRGISGPDALQSLARFLTPSPDMAKLLPLLTSILESLAGQEPQQAQASNAAFASSTSPTREDGATAFKTLPATAKNVDLPASLPQALVDQASGAFKGQQLQSVQNQGLPTTETYNLIKTDSGMARTATVIPTANPEPEVQLKTPASIPKPEANTQENQPPSKPAGAVSSDSSKASPPGSVLKTAQSTLGVQMDKAHMLKIDGNPIPAGILVNDEATKVMQGISAAGLLPEESEPAPPRNPLSRSILNLLDTLRNVLEIRPDDPPERLAVKIQAAILGEKDILRALNLLKEICDNKEIVEKLPQLKEFAQRLNSLEKEITGQQLYNVSNKHSHENISSFYFSFPVPLDKGYGLCQLKISKDSRQSLRDVDDLSLVVSLDTNKLGVVLFYIHWHKKGQLELQGVVENQASCNYLNQNAQQLVESLEALGYQVNHKGVRMNKSSQEVHSLKPVLQEAAKPGPLRLGIDVTV